MRDDSEKRVLRSYRPFLPWQNGRKSPSRGNANNNCCSNLLFHQEASQEDRGHFFSSEILELILKRYGVGMTSMRLVWAPQLYGR